MRTGPPSAPGPVQPGRNEGKGDKPGPGKGFRHWLGIIVLLGLAVELLLRPFVPELVRGESTLTAIVRLALALVGLDLAQ